MGKPSGSPGGGNGHGNKDGGSVIVTHIGDDLANTMDCGDGDDVVFGLGGDDLIIGGGGNDVMDGGEGSDTYMISGFQGADQFSDTGTGADDYDMVVAGADGTIFCLDGFGPDSGIEEFDAGVYEGVNIRGTGDSDVMDFSQTKLTGIAYIHGMNGHDVIIGSQDGDLIFGGLGDDSLDGQGGDDVLNGGYGSDVLTGGAGNDIFRLTAISDSADIFTDFTSGEDKVDLSAITANSDYVAYSLVQKGQNTIVRVELSDGSTNDLAILQGIDADSLSGADFLV